jgi:hypothetical protein
LTTTIAAFTQNRARLAGVARWFSLPAEKLAWLIKAALPDLSDAHVAEIVGVSRTTLYSWQSYRELKEALKPPPLRLPTGIFNKKDGTLVDAWMD